MLLKLALPVLTVMPVVVQLKVAVPLCEAAAPLLCSLMVTVTVSPGSRRPLLLPVGSEKVISPKANSGAFKVRVKL